MFSDVVSILSVSTLPSTTICPRMQTPTCTVSVVPVVSVPRVSPSLSWALRKMNRSWRISRSASRSPFRKFLSQDLWHLKILAAR
jgi:hypothetical protein